jgi:hypothetical protein
VITKELGSLELRYVPDSDSIVPSAGRHLPYVGSGEGSIEGPRLRGRLRFSAFEDELRGSSVVRGDEACALNLAATISTTDGAMVRLEALGYALREVGTRWQTALAVRLASDDPRYAWVGDGAASWLGWFDEATGVAGARLLSVAI